MKILDVRIDNLSRGEIHEKIRDFLKIEASRGFITTLNPEIILKANRNPKYKNILNSADLNLCDGFGIKLVSRLKRKKIRTRLTGVDLVDFLLKKANEFHLNVFVGVAENSLSSPGDIKLYISRLYPNLEIQSEYIRSSQDWQKNDIINTAEIVFVNFGAPDQENFIFDNRTKFPKAKILVGVGGAFDFLTGKIRRAPRWTRRIGFEWLWRLIQEPKRFHRIWNAVVVFPIVALLKR
jgi:N-acetylglucosaminyldiphosphoundecaprenol N-acetyl-beta-D-mannosaminyltransferase